MHTLGLVDAPEQPLATHYHVSGLTRTSFSSLFRGQAQPIGEAEEFSALVAGTGDLDGTEAVFPGVISAKGRRLEIRPLPPRAE